MLDNITTVTVNGETYPAVCNLRILEQIQKKFGTTKKFIELMDPKKNEEPDIGAILYVLPKMILAGMELDKDERRIEIRKEEDIVARLGMNIFQLATVTMRIYANGFKTIKNQ